MEPARDDAKAVAMKAYVYGYPLVLMDITRRVGTAVPSPSPRTGKAPVNQLVHLGFLPDHTFRDVVRPNRDTVYSIVWFDLSEEPVVLSVPATGDRYYLLPLLDAWTNVFAVPGTRTTGNGAGDFAITGPGWRGDLPRGVQGIESPTNMVWMIGRTQVDGPDDMPAVSALINQYKIAPLSAWGTDYVPPEVPVDPDVDLSEPMFQVEKMDETTFFGYVSALMVQNPPAPDDATLLAEARALGLEPGRFEPGPGVLPALEGVKEAALTQMKEHARKAGRVVNGWAVPTEKIGAYGTDYLQRASVALVGLGANLPEDAVYPNSIGVDEDGQPVTAEGRYVIHFESKQVPPVNAFWSLTMYDEEGYMVENPIGRYAVGSRDALRFHDDGSLEIYLQQQSPGADKESNWLPTPAVGGFQPTLRLYWPRDEVLSGAWSPPPIQKVD